jgi:hypothetical protein
MPTILAPAILTPAVRYLVASALSGSSPVALADLGAAHHKHGEDFGGHGVVGITVGCSTLELMAHADLHRSSGRSYAWP